MIIKEKGTNMKITAETKEYLAKKLAHLEKLLDPKDDSVLCEVELGRTTRHHKGGDVFRTEINLRVGGRNLRAESETDDLLSSIDLAKDEMVRELQIGKDKRVSKAKQGGAKIKKMIRREDK